MNNDTYLLSTPYGDYEEHDVQFAKEMEKDRQLEAEIEREYEIRERIMALEEEIAEHKANGEHFEADIKEQELEELEREWQILTDIA